MGLADPLGGPVQRIAYICLALAVVAYASRALWARDPSAAVDRVLLVGGGLAVLYAVVAGGRMRGLEGLEAFTAPAPAEVATGAVEIDAAIADFVAKLPRSAANATQTPVMYASVFREPEVDDRGKWGASMTVTPASPPLGNVMVGGLPLAARSVRAGAEIATLSEFSVAMLVRFKSTVGSNVLLCEIPQYKQPATQQTDDKVYWPALRVRASDRPGDACGGLVSHINLNVAIGGSNADFGVRVFPDGFSMVLMTVTADRFTLRVDPMEASLAETRLGSLAMAATQTWTNIGNWQGAAYDFVKVGGGDFALYSFGVYKPGFALSESVSKAFMEYYTAKVAAVVGEADYGRVDRAVAPVTCPFRNDSPLSPCYSNNTAACGAVAWDSIPSLVTARAECKMAVSNYCAANRTTDPACFCWNPAAPEMAYPSTRESCRLWRAFVGNESLAPPAAASNAPAANSNATPPPVAASNAPAPPPPPATDRVADYHVRDSLATEAAKEIDALRLRLRAGGTGGAGGVADPWARPPATSALKPASADDGSGFSLVRAFRGLFS